MGFGVRETPSVQLDQWRIADGYFNTSGEWLDTPEAVHESLRDSISDGHPELADGPDLTPTWFVTRGSAPELLTPGKLVLDDGTEVSVTSSLPPDLPLGSHRLLPSDGGPMTNLFIVPARQALPGRSWGWSSQLYATRSRSSWGHGDLGDLRQLATWAESLGAGLVAHNPLGSSIPLPQQQPSPYFGSSRRFLSILYLNIGDIPGAELIGADLDNLARLGSDLNRTRLIDRDQVFALKIAALEKIWQVVRSRTSVQSALDSADVSLRLHSTFCALAEQHGSGWSGWPAQFRDPHSSAVRAFVASAGDRVRFWIWVHLELERQMKSAATAGSGLMADLAVGFDPDGSDAWVDQDLLALDCRIGAPGDDFNPQGQDWGVAPYIPWKLRNAAYQPWIETLRHSLRFCDALRIDHVMGLFRLFWLSGHGDAPESVPGAYVYQFGSELLDVALMEAARSGSWLAGEDLGTVEAEVRSAMADRGILGYRVGWFEDDPPRLWPVESIGSLNTHDLPTVAGVRSLGTEGSSGSPAGDTFDENDRLLLRRLAGLVEVGHESIPGSVSDEQVILASHESLAEAGSAIVFASLDDTQVVLEQPNHPGTVDEFPNWRLALPVPIDEFDETLAPDIAATMRRHHR